jgi:hypothetical protein
MLKKITLFLTLFLMSCATGKIHESPVIYFSNASLKPIKNLKCEWATKHVLSLPNLNPGETRSQSFYIKSDDEFFGLVKLSWSADNGNSVSREFFFRKTSLPSIDDPTTYNYVQLYFDQEYVDISTSDAPDIGGKSAQMDKLLILYHNQYIKENKVDDPGQLIRVQPRRNTSGLFMDFVY